MCRRQSVRNLGAGINISRRQKIWWVSKTQGRKSMALTLLSLCTHTHVYTLTPAVTTICPHPERTTLCLPAVARSRNTFLSCYLIIPDDWEQLNPVLSLNYPSLTLMSEPNRGLWMFPVSRTGRKINRPLPGLNEIFLINLLPMCFCIYHLEKYPLTLQEMCVFLCF